MGRLWRVLAVVAVLSAGCARSENTFTPVEEFSSETAGGPEFVEDEGLVVEQPPPDLGSVDGLPALGGLIAVTSDTAITIIQPHGTPVIEFEDDRRGFLPTWSSDGQFIAVSFASGDSADILVIDMERPTQVRQTPVESAPFMYSWTDDSRYLATLAGPGPDTTLRIYDAAVGAPIPSVSGASVYVSWEPGGTDIVAHVEDRLDLVDGTTGAVISEVATVGSSFLAADWVPGTREVVVISGDDGFQKLLRVDVDDGTFVELADLGGPAGMEVSPDGSRVAISHFTAEAGDERSAMTEVLDLLTGERIPIADELSTWLEWSPDGKRLLTLATLVGEGMWRILEADGTVTEGATFSPSDAERQAYLGFGDQYVVSANRWSPDGKAFVFAGSVDGVDGVFVQALDPLTDPILVAHGELASWSPR